MIPESGRSAGEGIATHSSILELPWWLSQTVKNLPAMGGDLGSIPGLGRSLEKGKATHSSILAWRIPWIEEPGGLQSTGSQRVGHN